VDYLAEARALADGLPGERPRIVPSGASGTVRARTRFTFEGTAYDLEVDVERAVVEGARSSVRHASFREGSRPADLETRLELTYLVDPAQDATFTAVIAQLRDLRARLGLDSDRYFELITAFVQHIPYDKDAGVGRFPVEVLADGKGDCDEKSRLLAGLAAREGYAVALLSFDAEAHMAVGVRAPGLDYKGTGYGFVESTSPSMVSFPFAENAPMQLNSAPAVSVVSNGPHAYRAAADLDRIVRARGELEAQIAEARAQQQAAEAEMQQLSRELDTLGARIDALGPRDPAAANALIPQHDALRQRHAAAMERAQTAFTRQDERVRAYNLIGDKGVGRAPLAQRLRALLDAPAASAATQGEGAAPAGSPPVAGPP
jgi:hypothetical protein